MSSNCRLHITSSQSVPQLSWLSRWCWFVRLGLHLKHETSSRRWTWFPGQYVTLVSQQYLAAWVCMQHLRGVYLQAVKNHLVDYFFQLFWFVLQDLFNFDQVLGCVEGTCSLSCIFRFCIIFLTLPKIFLRSHFVRVLSSFSVCLSLLTADWSEPDLLILQRLFKSWLA